MLDCLRKKLCCVSSHEEGEMAHKDLPYKNLNTFKVVAVSSLTSEAAGVGSGTLEVKDEELVHYQTNSDPIRWNYACLRKHSGGDNIFLFESGRRCSTGAGTFVFKCSRADVLRQVFIEKLNKFNDTRKLNRSSLSSQADLTISPSTRHSGSVASNHSASRVVEEPYLTPLSFKKDYVNSSVISGQQGHSYANWSDLKPTALEYRNIFGEENGQGTTTPSKDPPDGCYINGSFIKKLDYADLDLSLSDAENCHNKSRKSRTASAMSNADIEYVNMQRESLSDADVFAPPLPFGSADLAAPAPASDYINMQLGRNGWEAPAPSPHHNGTQYTIINFEKTAACGSIAWGTCSVTSEEAVRKTRHNSSVDNLN